MNDSTRAVLELIRVYNGACPKDFANNDIYRYSARIHDLRKQGYRIVAHECMRHAHRNRISQYVLLSEPGVR